MITSVTDSTSSITIDTTITLQLIFHYFESVSAMKLGVVLIVLHAVFMIVESVL